jgi:hypothetical protein
MRLNTDPGANLSEYGGDVEGVTEFRPNRKPGVRIVRKLAYDERRENRYRTTLTHEYGHEHFHGYLFELELRSGDLLQPKERNAVQVCNRNHNRCTQHRPDGMAILGMSAERCLCLYRFCGLSSELSSTSTTSSDL